MKQDHMTFSDDTILDSRSFSVIERAATAMKKILDLGLKGKTTDDAMKTLKMMFDYNNALKRAAKNVFNLTKQIAVSKPFYRL
jgi:hypothetical protein